MGDPLTLALVFGAFSALTTGAGIYRQNATARKQANMAMDAAKLQAQFEQAAIAAQATRDMIQARQQEAERRRQAMRELSTVTAAAGDIGLLGGTTLRLLEGIQANADLDIGAIRTERDMNVQNAQAAGLGTQAEADMAIEGAEANFEANSLPAWAQGLSIANSAVQGGAQGYTLGKLKGGA